MRRALLIVVAACSHDSTPPPAAPVRSPVESPHGGRIVELAVTPAGDAVVSVDERGGVRLWPDLDGRREPRVLDLHDSSRLAIVGRGGGFAIASIDPAGQLIVAAVDRDGIESDRTVLAGDAAYTDVVARGGNLLALRADQRLVEIRPDAALDLRAIVATLATEPGYRIAELVVRGGSAVAILESHDERRVRRLATGTLAWGAWLDVAVGRLLAVSPSGARLAYATPWGDAIVYDERGRAIGRLDAENASAVELVDDDLAGLVPRDGVDGVTWTATTSGGRTSAPDGEPPPHAVGGRTVVYAIDGELAVAMAGRPTAFLGYGVVDAKLAVAGPPGQLLVAHDGAYALLGPDLRDRPLELGTPEGARLADACWVGGSEWLVQTSVPNEDVVIAAVDTAAHRRAVLRTPRITEHLACSPETHRIAFSEAGKPEIRERVAPLSYVTVAALADDTFPLPAFEPVSPRLAGGVQAITVRERTTPYSSSGIEHMVVRWLDDLGAVDRGASIAFDGMIGAIGAAGQVFAFLIDPRDPELRVELAVLDRGRHVATLRTLNPLEDDVKVVPDPTGGRVLLVEATGVTCVTLDGTTLWSKVIAGVRTAVWLTGGGLAVVAPTGIARLDPATGETVAARCGWRFGRSPTPHGGVLAAAPLCG